MAYEIESEDYSVPDFYQKYGHSLPQLVRVSQGFCGDIVEDTFDKDQIMRIHTVARQLRVVARWKTFGQYRMYSIPLSFEEKLCVLKKHGNKFSKEKTIQQIIAEFTLPVEVQFSKTGHFSVNGQTFHSCHLPTFELTHVFEEMCLMGNFVLEGIIGEDVVPVPLYLSDLRLVRCIGIKDKPQGDWNNFIEELTNKCAMIEYSNEYGNPNIAVYHTEAVHNDTEYSYAEPANYVPLSSLFQKHQQQEGDAPEIEGNVYETIGDNEHSKHHVATIPAGNLLHEGKQRQPVKVLPPVLPKPSFLSGKGLMTSPGSDGNDVKSPPLPARQPLSKQQARISQKSAKSHYYSNDIPKSNVAPIASSTYQKVSEPVKEKVESTFAITATPPSQKAIAEVKKETSSPTIFLKVTGTEDVGKLNLNDVGEYLKLLKLDKYVDEFKENLIDGQMLRELDKDILNESFGMKGLEAIRLMKFIRDGHVPT